MDEMELNEIELDAIGIDIEHMEAELSLLHKPHPAENYTAWKFITTALSS
jgi:hypothetical protein